MPVSKRANFNHLNNQLNETPFLKLGNPNDVEVEDAVIR